MKNDHIRKNNFLLLISFVGIVSVLLMEPLAQNQAYHEFADQRGYLSIPNFWNIVSNVSFLIVVSVLTKNRTY
jgi:hypothetical protein